MIKNRHGQSVELDNISKVEFSANGSCTIDRETGWGTFILTADELDGFVPQVGDAIVVMTTNMSFVRGVIIENRVLRYHTKAQTEAAHKQMTDGFRLEKLERYVKDGDALKARVKNLHPRLRARMYRFAAEDGEEFWIDSATYEMYALEGANALINKVTELFPLHTDTDQRVQWIEDWWNMNTKEGGYDYKGQMALLPEFGDGHSGNTAGAAYGLALRVLKGEEV